MRAFLKNKPAVVNAYTIIITCIHIYVVIVFVSFLPPRSLLIFLDQFLLLFLQRDNDNRCRRYAHTLLYSARVCATLDENIILCMDRA